MDDMATSLKTDTPIKEDGSIDEVALADKLVVDFATHDVEVSDASVQLIAEGIAASFTAEELETLSNDEIIDRLIERFGSANTETSAS